MLITSVSVSGREKIGEAQPVDDDRPSKRAHTGLIQEDLAMPRVLVIDDDVELTQMLGDFLTREGFTVAFASNGTDALVALKIGRAHV